MNSTGTELIDHVKQQYSHYMMKFIETWRKAVVFCDLSAAFDTLDHEDILAKMRIYVFTESSVAWYRGYLSNRAQ